MTDKQLGRYLRHWARDQDACRLPPSYIGLRNVLREASGYDVSWACETLGIPVVAICKSSPLWGDFDAPPGYAYTCVCGKWERELFPYEVWKEALEIAAENEGWTP